MKLFEFIILFVICMFPILLFLSSCENEKNVKSELDYLKNQRNSLRIEVKILTELKNLKENEIILLNENLKELNIYNSDKIPKYILKIRLK